MFQEINFSPYRTNVLDCVGRNDLVTEDGQPVSIVRNFKDFIITISDQTYRTDDNLTASAILNNHFVGVRRK